MLLLTVFHHLFEEEIDFAAVVIVNIVIVVSVLATSGFRNWNRVPVLLTYIHDEAAGMDTLL